MKQQSAELHKRDRSDSDANDLRCDNGYAAAGHSDDRPVDATGSPATSRMVGPETGSSASSRVPRAQAAPEASENGPASAPAAPHLSIVVPVLNEEENIASLHEEIVETCEQAGYSYEIIIVDDGSSDGTQQVVESLAPVTYIRLRRNFGQTSAMDAGIKHARGRYIVTMDGDGQNDPADIPALVTHLEDTKVDCVSGWRRNRKDTLRKRMASRAAALVRRKLISDGIHDSGCSLKVYKAECFKGISLFGEMHRFIPAVLKIKGFEIGELAVNHRPRRAGKTKYTWKRGVKGLIDMVSVWFWHKYAVRPLHLLGGLGVLFLLAGMVVSGVGIGFYIADITIFRFFLPQLATFLLITGVQLFVFGLMADMMARTYFETSPDSAYSIAEVIRRPEAGEQSRSTVESGSTG